MKLLLFDCEAFPNVGWTWGSWEQNLIEVIERRMICSISWQWYPKREIFTLALPDFPGYDHRIRNNTKLMKAFAKEMNCADVAIGHNIVKYDDPMVNTDIVINKMDSAAPHRVIDTLTVCRSRFRFNSNRLNDVCQALGIGSKVPHPGFQMWKDCMRGDMKAWKKMKEYNAGDVDPLLRGLYERIRPWIKNHPNMSVDKPSPACPSCGHFVLKEWSWVYTQTRTYQRMFCLGCRSWCKKVMVGKKGAFVYRP